MKFRPRINLTQNRLSVSQDPLIIHQGEDIEFEVLAKTQDDQQVSLKNVELLWELYFEGDTPFKSTEQKVFALATNVFGRFGNKYLDHVAILRLGKAEESGHYKYGVRVSKSKPKENENKSTSSKKVIDDFDPLIIVIS